MKLEPHRVGRERLTRHLQQAFPCMALENLCVPDVTPQRVHALVPRLIGQLESHAPRRRSESRCAGDGRQGTQPRARGERQAHSRCGHLLIGTPLPSLATGRNRKPVSIPGAFSFPRSQLNLILPNDSQEVGMFCFRRGRPGRLRTNASGSNKRWRKPSRPIAGRSSSARQGELWAAAGRTRRISSC